MPNPLRIRRISQRIKEELAVLLLRESADPRLPGTLVTDVRVDRELAYAEIYVSALEGKERAEEILAGLNHAAGFLRSALAERIELRSLPRLRFHWDPTPEKADHMEKLFAEMRRQDEERARNQQDGEGE